MKHLRKFNENTKYNDSDYDYTGFTKDITLEGVKNAIHEALQEKGRHSSHFSHQLEHGANADLNMDVEKLAQRIMYAFHNTLSYISEQYEGELEDIINGDFK